MVIITQSQDQIRAARRDVTPGEGMVMVSLLGTISLGQADCRCAFRLRLSDSERKIEGNLIKFQSHVRTATVLCVCFSDQKQVCHFDFLIDEQSSRFQFRPLLGVSLRSGWRKLADIQEAFSNTKFVAYSNGANPACKPRTLSIRNCPSILYNQ